jgi:hypothetical protein
VADELWHEFICHTQLYHQFCRSIAGFYIHHQPETSDSEVPSLACGEPTRTLYERHFGRMPEPLWQLAKCEGGCSQCSSQGEN